MTFGIRTSRNFRAIGLGKYGLPLYKNRPKSHRDMEMNDIHRHNMAESENYRGVKKYLYVFKGFHLANDYELAKYPGYKYVFRHNRAYYHYNEKYDHPYVLHVISIMKVKKMHYTVAYNAIYNEFGIELPKDVYENFKTIYDKYLPYTLSITMGGVTSEYILLKWRYYAINGRVYKFYGEDVNLDHPEPNLYGAIWVDSNNIVRGRDPEIPYSKHTHKMKFISIEEMVSGLSYDDEINGGMHTFMDDLKSKY